MTVAVELVRSHLEVATNTLKKLKLLKDYDINDETFFYIFDAAISIAGGSLESTSRDAFNYTRIEVIIAGSSGYLFINETTAKVSRWKRYGH